MNKKQQELYEKLLKKVNEYCLGAAAEDVIEAIDNLVDEYEYPVDRSNTTKDNLKALERIVETFIDKDSEDIETVRTALINAEKYKRTVEILKKHLEPKLFQRQNLDIGNFYMGITFGLFHASYQVTKEEWCLLKEAFTNERTY